jgi:acetyl-CoA acetyltransferase
LSQPAPRNKRSLLRARDRLRRDDEQLGCSLVWGHPQGPTGLHAIIELIEELEMRGGGYGLYQGCAAGDSAMAVVVQVTDTRKHV